jgi:GxxExxY protein
MTGLLFKEAVYARVGAAVKVCNYLGPGFLDHVHEQAMEIERASRKIPSKPSQEVHITLKGKELTKLRIADAMCHDKIIVEIKAMDKLSMKDEGQLVNDLKATGLKVGTLINFGHSPSLEWKRLVITQDFFSRLTRPDRHAKSPLAIKLKLA